LLEPGPDVQAFIRPAPEGEREVLFVRQNANDVEIELLLPSANDLDGPSITDERLQLFEGVSHFVYLAERARIDLPMTELELELQAEVDKFVLLAFDGEHLVPERTDAVRRALYDGGQYLDPADSERGARYRLANALAARLCSGLPRARQGARDFLGRFYRSGQADKIRLARAA
jgi:hypothetical protein